MKKSNIFTILFLSIAIGLFACAIAVLAFTNPGSQPPNGNPVFWLLSGTSMYYSAGSVGIGTSTPSVQLEVNGRVKDKTGYLDPIGTVNSYAGSSAPQGWLICNGAAISRTTYADLFAIVGTTYGVGDGSTTFNIPDLRGEFIRGFDGGRGIDSGRTLGSWQTDMFASHTHSITQMYGDRSPFTGSDFSNLVPSQPGYSTGQPKIGSTGGTETRPRNVALNYIIKY